MSNKTIAVFTNNDILFTQANQKYILQALHDGLWFKNLGENQIILLDLVFPDYDDTHYQKSEVQVLSLSHLSECFCQGDLSEYGITEDSSFLHFISFEQIVDFNIGEL